MSPRNKSKWTYAAQGGSGITNVLHFTGAQMECALTFHTAQTFVSCRKRSKEKRRSVESFRSCFATRRFQTHKDTQCAHSVCAVDRLIHVLGNASGNRKQVHAGLQVRLVSGYTGNKEDIVGPGQTSRLNICLLLLPQLRCSGSARCNHVC